MEISAEDRARLQKTMARCHDCKEEKPLIEFYLRARTQKSGRVVFSKRDSYCKKHWCIRTAAGSRKRPANNAFQRYRDNAKAKGQAFEITVDLIKDLFQLPCGYCGETELMITLDRIRNDDGYTPENVVQACIRCNLVKADMPHEAWLRFVAPAMKSARESGEFGNWSGRKNFNQTRPDVIK